MALNSFTLKVRCFHISLLSSKPKISNEETIGVHGWSQSPRNPAVPFHLHFWEFRSIFPFHGNGDFDVSPCWEEKKGQKCLRKGGQKSLEIMPSPSSMAWSFLCVPFPLCSPEWKVDFSSSFSLPRLHPALGSWQCQHSHPEITVKIASFFFDNKIQQPFGIPVVPQSPDPWLGPRGFVAGC